MGIMKISLLLLVLLVSFPAQAIITTQQCDDFKTYFDALMAQGEPFGRYRNSEISQVRHFAQTHTHLLEPTPARFRIPEAAQRRLFERPVYNFIREMGITERGVLSPDNRNLSSGRARLSERVLQTLCIVNRADREALARCAAQKTPAEITQMLNPNALDSALGVSQREAIARIYRHAFFDQAAATAWTRNLEDVREALRVGFAPERDIVQNRSGCNFPNGPGAGGWVGRRSSIPSPAPVSAGNSHRRRVLRMPDRINDTPIGAAAAASNVLSTMPAIMPSANTGIGAPAAEGLAAPAAVAH